MARDVGYYRTGDDKIDEVLFSIHYKTMSEPDDLNIDGPDYGDFLGDMIRLFRQLPDGHPIKALGAELMTSGAHAAWNKARVREEYAKLIGDLWPALDQLNKANPAT